MNKINQQKKGNENQILKIVIVILVATLLFVILTLIFEPNEPITKLITAVISLATATLPLIIRMLSPNPNHLENNSIVSNDEISPPISNDETFDLFIYGHSGSGKTSFIKKLFVFGKGNTVSTENFDYYTPDVFLDIKAIKGSKRNQKANKKIQTNIADYKGQKVTQIFDGLQKNPYVNAVLFFADVAPSYSEEGRKLTHSQIIELMSENFEEELMKRVNIHRNKYLSEFLIQAVFEYAYNRENLKSVRFVVNKMDILEDLQNKGIIDKDVNLEEYVLEIYQETIGHIEKFCKANSIPYFQTELISATKSMNTREMFTELLEEYSN